MSVCLRPRDQSRSYNNWLTDSVTRLVGHHWLDHNGDTMGLTSLFLDPTSSTPVIKIAIHSTIRLPYSDECIAESQSESVRTFFIHIFYSNDRNNVVISEKHNCILAPHWWASSCFVQSRVWNSDADSDFILHTIKRGNYSAFLRINLINLR